MKKLKSLLSLPRILWLRLTNNRNYVIAQKIRTAKVSYLNIPALLDLSDLVSDIEKQNQAGIFIEAGCALGGSAIMIASNKKPQRPFLIFDSFERIPPPSENDGEDAHTRFENIQSGKSKGINGDIYYGYQENLLEKVVNNFREFNLLPEENNLNFIKGYFENTLTVDQPVIFAHLDCDWYDSVLLCLKVIVPQLTKGGVIVVDDYSDWSGCKKAVDEYFADIRNDFEFNQKNRLQIKKIK
jgi:asparagine synthase (glutamine-hydrolysing)